MSQNHFQTQLSQGPRGSAVGAAAALFLGPLRPCAEGASVGFLPGTYTSVQTTPYATVEVKCSFSDSALTEVSYEVLKTSTADYFTPFANPLNSYCERIVEAGTTEGVDGVTGASLCSNAIRDGVNACKVQALGLTIPAVEKTVLNPQDEDFTSFDGDLAEVLSPIQLGSMTIRNRTIKSAGSGPWADVNGSKVSSFRELYGTMSQNGVGLILLAGGAIRNNGILPDGLEVRTIWTKALAEAAELVIHRP